MRWQLAAFLPTWDEGLKHDGDGNVEVKSLQDFVTVAANLIEIALMFAGILAAIFIIIGGVLYITSLDDPARKAKAKETIFYAITGLVICLSAYGIVKFITGVF